MIKDQRGMRPNYVFDRVEMIHQPTGLKVSIMSGSEASLRIAWLALKQMVKEASDGSLDAVDGGGLAGVQPPAPEGS